MLERLFGGHGGSRHGGGGGHHGSQGGHGYGRDAPPLPPGGSACPACRAVNAAGARFCQQCGTSMLPAACRQCGTALAPGAKFCAQCGQSTQAT
ncbi:double zinc ribbon domain-containing protein [Variovorax boronicumulans]|uniref:double zinc ribbon domain-containing protein n=1 Tax=Variovorax boronicumulans TaxID=436515 RepID=UPI003F4DA5A8